MIGAFSTLPAQALFTEIKPPLRERATPDILAEFFPTADHFVEVEGRPTVFEAYLGEERLGFVLSAFDAVKPPSYTRQPFDALVGIDVAGTITGVRLIKFYDSYLVDDPVQIARVEAYLAKLVGFEAMAGRAFLFNPDFATGTTISARSMAAGILDAARLVFRANSGPPITEPTLDMIDVGFRSWNELMAMGGIIRRVVTYGEVRDLFAAAGAADVATDVELGVPRPTVSETVFGCRFEIATGCTDTPRPVHPDDEVYTDLYVALGTPPMIGRSMLEPDRYNAYYSNKPAGTQMLLMFSSGPYNFRGVNYYKEENGYQFDRFRLVQGDLEIIFTRDDHQLLNNIAGDRPWLPNASAYFIAPDAGFDPLQPFEVDLLVNGVTASGDAVSVAVPVAYQVPPDVVLLPYVEPPAEWVTAWQQSMPNVIILGIALIVLTCIFIFQKQLTQRRKLHLWLRTGFLVFTLFWLGWTAGGQLSIEHVTNYLRMPFEGVDLNFLLREPLIAMVSLYVIVSMILIGRGVFCGWLCPFGALQELTGKVARFLRLPSWTPPDWLHRWMWLPKYGTAGLIVIVTFAAPASFATAGEIEPFNTAIGSVFSRPAPYVVYAVILVVMSLFTERFFCRFLCPLGGFLAVADRLHIFTFLKRRAECGSGGCHLCERSCPVRAIEKNGKIIMAECFQCLDCQVEYYDDHRCPPLSKQRKAKERAVKKSAPVVAQPPMGLPVPAFARTAAIPAMEPARTADL